MARVKMIAAAIVLMALAVGVGGLYVLNRQKGSGGEMGREVKEVIEQGGFVVSNWDAKRGMVSLVTENEEREITINLLQMGVVVRKETGEETVYFPGSGGGKPPFCPGDKVEITLKDGSKAESWEGFWESKIKTIRNLGPRECGI